ncbi:hypothetical protein SODALDRAFT_351784 [Sodiomyces alkalinus F11]|uniref:Uncharacterized protein n=1 Tax=Sodiomyces alkalinus (strain CBS 110278 / VKM F-3762 / F11) TaxID=1314773 RepID=A0A3N2PSQ6_SODAK|nr:hypothetical protein SODALDRAFT_351784 [Sodiomyces alkalinus F11]ROT37518.1 hypothetical protein SODALDRAFT_351784 [Sodiomyces alkalinus F11]
MAPHHQRSESEDSYEPRPSRQDADGDYGYDRKKRSRRGIDGKSDELTRRHRRGRDPGGGRKQIRGRTRTRTRNRSRGGDEWDRDREHAPRASYTRKPRYSSGPSCCGMRRSRPRNGGNNDDETSEDDDEFRPRRLHYPRPDPTTKGPSANGANANTNTNTKPNPNIGNQRPQPRSNTKPNAKPNAKTETRAKPKTTAKAQKAAQYAALGTAVRVALQSGAQAAYKLRNHPSPWLGEKGLRVVAAAVVPGIVDGYLASRKASSRSSSAAK